MTARTDTFTVAQQPVDATERETTSAPGIQSIAPASGKRRKVNDARARTQVIGEGRVCLQTVGMEIT